MGNMTEFKFQVNEMLNKYCSSDIRRREFNAQSTGEAFLNNSAEKQKERERIETAKKEFFEKGGKIKLVIPPWDRPAA